MGSSRIYLGKSGRIFGPYGDRDIAEMRATGELERFSWIWQSSAPGWQPIDPPPPPVAESAGAPIEAPLPAPGGPVRVTGAAPPLHPRPQSQRLPASLPVDSIDAVCHDYRHVVAGQLARVSETGCELIAPGDAAPQFLNLAKVYLSLLNSKTGQTIDVTAQLNGAHRSSTGWTYKLEWERVPDLLKKGAA